MWDKKSLSYALVWILWMKKKKKTKQEFRKACRLVATTVNQSNFLYMRIRLLSCAHLINCVHFNTRVYNRYMDMTSSKKAEDGVSNSNNNATTLVSQQTTVTQQQQQQQQQQQTVDEVVDSPLNSPELLPISSVSYHQVGVLLIHWIYISLCHSQAAASGALGRLSSLWHSLGASHWPKP